MLFICYFMKYYLFLIAYVARQIANNVQALKRLLSAWTRKGLTKAG